MPCFPICQRQCPNLIEAPRSRCRANGGFPCPASAIHRLMRGLTVAMLIFVALSALERGQSRQFARDLRPHLRGACSDSDSRHPTPPKLAHPDCRLSERYGFHTIGNQRRALSISVRAPARNPPWLNPVPRLPSQATCLVRARASENCRRKPVGDVGPTIDCS